MLQQICVPWNETSSNNSFVFQSAGQAAFCVLKQQQIAFAVIVLLPVGKIHIDKVNQLQISNRAWNFYQGKKEGETMLNESQNLKIISTLGALNL